MLGLYRGQIFDAMQDIKRKVITLKAILWFYGYRGRLLADNILVVRSDFMRVLRRLYLYRSLYEIRFWFLRAIKNVDTFIDVGANIGGYTIRACRWANVVALEPAIENYNLLLENIKLNNCSNVKALNIAAGDEAGYFTLYLPDHTHLGTYTFKRKW